jgi:hypothetical protein
MSSAVALKRVLGSLQQRIPGVLFRYDAASQDFFSDVSKEHIAAFFNVVYVLNTRERKGTVFFFPKHL